MTNTKKQHPWYTLNREYHAPSEIGVRDLASEIEVALELLTEDEFVATAEYIDTGRYELAAKWIAKGLARIK